MTEIPTDSPPVPKPPAGDTDDTPDFAISKFEAVARLLNSFGTLELKLFGDKYGFEIRHGLTKFKKYPDMSAAEKESFDAYHGLSGRR